MVSSFFFVFSSPNLSRRRLDVYHTSAHDVGLSANFECMSEMCCMRLADNTRHKTSPSAHQSTTMSNYWYTFATNEHRQSENLLNSDISSTCPHNMANFGPLTADIRGHPIANFSGFRVLASLLQRRRLPATNQTLHAEAHLGMFGRTGAPTKRGPHKRTCKFVQQSNMPEIIIRRRFYVARWRHKVSSHCN